MPRQWDALNAWLWSAYWNILCTYLAPRSWYSPIAIHVCWKDVSDAAIELLCPSPGSPGPESCRPCHGTGHSTLSTSSQAKAGNIEEPPDSTMLPTVSLLVWSGTFWRLYKAMWWSPGKLWWSFTWKSSSGQQNSSLSSIIQCPSGA